MAVPLHHRSPPPDPAPSYLPTGGDEVLTHEVLTHEVPSRDRPLAAVAPLPPQPAWRPDSDGPHVRWGVLWFGMVVAAGGWSMMLLAAAMAVTAASPVHALVATDPTVTRRFAVTAAAVVPLAALDGAGSMTVVVPLMVITAMALLLTDPSASIDSLSRASAYSLLIGGAAAAPVVAADVGLGASLGLVALVAAHDTGNYLIGTGARAWWEGPVAGAICVAVAGFALGSFNVLGVGAASTGVVAATVALAAPVGGPLARLLLAGAATKPRGLAAACIGRLDALLVAGPLGAAVVLAVA